MQGSVSREINADGKQSTSTASADKPRVPLVFCLTGTNSQADDLHERLSDYVGDHVVRLGVVEDRKVSEMYFEIVYFKLAWAQSNRERGVLSRSMTKPLQRSWTSGTQRSKQRISMVLVLASAA